jgi:hypothetical protein
MPCDKVKSRPERRVYRRGLAEPNRDLYQHQDTMTNVANPYQTASPTSDVSQKPQRSARQQLLPVAISLLVLSILHIIFGLCYFVFVYSVSAVPDADPLAIHTSTVLAMYVGITMLYCLLLASGAFSMMRQGSYMWAMTVCILSMIPILGPCYFFGVPVGIWGILVLRRQDVRDSFARM